MQVLNKEGFNSKQRILRQQLNSNVAKKHNNIEINPDCWAKPNIK